ncbi:zinc carboxypeptidase-like [Achroia grisella]|uniref:zinc carboxypeptidase-like n=1 Tax=Achroia grisella TaxID=688607 RepID=UPI0027D27BAE|nr:zinc carboxypeptidase-like [Achroia grisella]
MLKYITLFIFLILSSFTLCQKVRYDDYSLFKILPKNPSDFKVLEELQQNDLRYDFWTSPRAAVDFVSVMAGPKEKDELKNFLSSHGINYEIPVSNIQEAIDKESVKNYTGRSSSTMSWNSYYGLTDIYVWIDDLASLYPNIVSVIIGGETYEGRDIKGLRISHGSGRKGIFIESGIHAREWITVATTCYIINQLLTSNDTEIQQIARDYDWYIFPVTNPDGYLHTFTRDRMWRKNRRPINANAYGVDLNRNWNNNWLMHGASLNPSTQTYAGPGPFSEVESRTLSTYIEELGNRIELYLSFHSFSQLLLIPFGNTTEPLANYNDAVNIGRRAMGALSARYGTMYTTGNIAEAIYLATGGSVDWVKEVIKVPLVYCYEFRDKGQYGFNLPADQILPNSEETMDSIVELIFQARRFGYLV